MPVLPRRDAARRVHHPGVGDRPDPRPPPDPRRARGARRAAEPPIDAGPREPEHDTRPTPVHPRSACDLRTVPTPRHYAGTFGVGGRPTGATDGSRRHRSPHGDRRSHGPRRTRTGGGHAAAAQTVLARSAIAPSTRRIVDPPRLKFLSTNSYPLVAPATPADSRRAAESQSPR